VPTSSAKKPIALRDLSRRDVEWLLKLGVRLPGVLYRRKRLSVRDVSRHYASYSRPVLADDPERLVQITRGALRRMQFQDYCMPQSLLALSALAPAHDSATIVFGVRKNVDALDGHAWIEIDGKPIGEDGNPREKFTVTYTYPEC
jgi:hypothetical protein